MQMNKLNNKPYERRTFLRGLGTAMALPWLESLAPRGLRATSTELPKRMAFVYMPNGAIMPQWTPKQTGRDYELSPTLKALEPVRDKIQILSGLAHEKAEANGDGGGDHARANATFLTASQARKTAGSDIHLGVSVDQVAAAQVGHLTRFPSVELGCDNPRGSGKCDSGYSCAYQYNIRGSLINLYRPSMIPNWPLSAYLAQRKKVPLNEMLSPKNTTKAFGLCIG